jgi:hypothetical protein
MKDDPDLSPIFGFNLPHYRLHHFAGDAADGPKLYESNEPIGYEIGTGRLRASRLGASCQKKREQHYRGRTAQHPFHEPLLHHFQ